MAKKAKKLYPARLYYVIWAGSEDDLNRIAVPLLSHAETGRILPVFGTERKAERYSARFLDAPQTYMSMLDTGPEEGATALSRGYMIMCWRGDYVIEFAQNARIEAFALDPEPGGVVEPIPFDGNP